MIDFYKIGDNQDNKIIFGSNNLQECDQSKFTEKPSDSIYCWRTNGGYYDERPTMSLTFKQTGIFYFSLYSSKKSLENTLALEFYEIIQVNEQGLFTFD